MALKHFSDTAIVLKVYHFKGFSNWNEIDGIVNKLYLHH